MRLEDVDLSYLTPGTSGPWTVETFEVSEAESKFTLLRSMHVGRREYVPAGVYWRLKHERRGVVMSSTPAETNDLREPWRQAERLAGKCPSGGRVLVNGLGLGIAVAGFAEISTVSEITVVEIDPDVYALIVPALSEQLFRRGVTLTVHVADAFETCVPGKFVVGWHDVWDNVCADNLPEMTKLKRRYGGKCAWQGCWAEAECRQGRWS